MQNQTYQISKTEDGSVRVDYVVGKIERVYQIPTAITRERYEQFTSQMKKSTKKKVSSLYTLVEPSKLDKRDDKDELIAMYPSITEQVLYLLKSTANATNKEKLEGYFAEGGYTADDFAIDQQLVAGSSDTSGPVFNVSMIYSLEGRDLVVKIPYSELRYRADYPLTYLAPLPMFGAAGLDEEGFMFIPEGGGAIINYNNGKLSQSPYYANLYGWDYAVQRKEAISETENAFPVFGATHDGGSFICMMEGASSFAGVNADISGRYNAYNTVYARYNVLHAEQFNVSAKTAQLVYMYEAEVPEEEIVQRYRFVDSSSYVDMANAYGDYLREREPRLKEARAGNDVPVNLELIGAIDKKVVKFGVPVDSVVPVTTFQQAQDIVKDFTGKGIPALNVRMTGWSNGGVRQRVLTSVHVAGELGGEKGLQQLVRACESQGVNIYLDGISCFAYNSGIFNGFLSYSNAARYATRDQVHLYPYDIITYTPAEWMQDYYLVRPEYAKTMASNLIAFIEKQNATGVAFRDVGNLLSADYYNHNLVTREKVKRMNVETLKEAVAAGQKVSIREGNDYAIAYADLITDMNLTGQGYAIVDERIPFYQIAIHGMKDFTGESINLSGDYETALLECAEYGAGLSFTFMAQNARILADSSYGCYNSADYNMWKEEALSIIMRYQQEMAGLNSQRITGHERLSEDVTVTRYEDGTAVYVNYGTEEYEVNGVSVPARDYFTERGKGQ